MSENEQMNIPEEYKPISMWGYLGYQILFALPLVGFIVLVIFALGGSNNKNVTNFARSYFCYLIVLIVFIALAFSLGLGANIVASLN